MYPNETYSWEKLIEDWMLVLYPFLLNFLCEGFQRDFRLKCPQVWYYISFWYFHSLINQVKQLIMF